MASFNLTGFGLNAVDYRENLCSWMALMVQFSVDFHESLYTSFLLIEFRVGQKFKI